MSRFRPVEKVTVWLVPGLLWAALAGFPARAQILLSGDWQTLMHEDQPERAQGPDLGDYLGIPINDAARLRAESWDASRLTLQEHQCRVHVAPTSTEDRCKCESGRKKIRRPSRRSLSKTTSAPTSRPEPFGWMAAPIPPRTRHTGSWDFPRESGK